MYGSDEYIDNLDILKGQMEEEKAIKYAEAAEEILQMYIEFIETNQKYLEGSLFYNRINQKLYDKHYIWIENINYYLETGLKLFPIDFKNQINELEYDYIGNETDKNMLKANYNIYLGKIFDIETDLANWLNKFNKKYNTNFYAGDIRKLLEQQESNYEKSSMYDSL